MKSNTVKIIQALAGVLLLLLPQCWCWLQVLKDLFVQVEKSLRPWLYSLYQSALVTGNPGFGNSSMKWMLH